MASNPYKEEFDKLVSEDSFRGQTWLGKRRDLVEKYSWAVPNEEVLYYLSLFDSITEVGAGNGYWAHCINENGGNARPTDIEVPDDADLWTDVQKKPVEYLDLTDEAVLTVWPPHEKLVAGQITGDKAGHILYVGESRGGCTGDDEFFRVLDKEYGLVKEIDIPSYEGVHDNFYHYVRNV